MLEATDSFLRAHDEWVEAPDTDLLTPEYEQALEDLLEGFADGDIPGRCRDLVAAVGTLAEEWEKFQGYVSQLRPHPRDSFWAAVEQVRQAREGAGEPQRKPLESVAQLVKQNVPLSQIAMYIYGYQPHEGAKHVGPFMRNGVPVQELIDQEVKEPGSVVPKDWVHPQEQARQRAEQERRTRCLRRLQEKVRSAPVAPESVEQLLREGVFANQIADMKQISVEEVYAEADRLGLKPADRPNLNTVRGKLDPPLNPHVERELDSRREEAERRDAESNETQFETVEEEIRSYLEADFSVTDVVQQTGATEEQVSAIAQAIQAEKEQAGQGQKKTAKKGGR